jgi:hypothetical protein
MSTTHSRIAFAGVPLALVLTAGAVIDASGAMGAVGARQSTSLLNPASPEFSKPAPAKSVVTLVTTKGEVDIEVTRDWAPRSADRSCLES